jgi:hypothetical protein
METNDMPGKGQLGVQRIPNPQAIPKMSKGPTRTGNAGSNFDAKKKMRKYLTKKGMVQ